METLVGDVVPDHWIVLLKPDVTADGKAAHLGSIQAMVADEDNPFSLQVHHEFDQDECRGYSAIFDLQSKEAIEQMDEVSFIEPVHYLGHCQWVTQQNSTWGLERISQPRRVQPNGPYNYRYRDNAAGQNAVAYIIDTGINDTHLDFQGRAHLGAKFVSSTPPASNADTMGHGTHVAGTVGSKTYGVAKNVQIIAVKVFSDTTRLARTDDIIMALGWVVNDARARGKKAAANMSLGGAYSPALNRAVAATVRRGIVVCVAAGNNMGPAEGISPASEPLAVTVAAMEKTERRSGFSNYGRLVDVFAPGTDITSTWIGSTTATQTLSGTSMATPHVTGIVCCLLSDGSLEDSTPYAVVSQVTIRADKNQLPGLDRATINGISQA